MYDTLVMKFGGASVATTRQFAKVAQIVLARKREARRLLVVVSAMGDMTDELISLAKEVNPSPPQREHDMLVSVGERVSISLLAMALARVGEEAVSFTGSQSGIITDERHSNARIIEVKPHRLLPVLEEGKIAIVAGFQGVSRRGEITTLGRGGSDTTAVALAIALNAPCVEFYKDVSGIYGEDPKVNAKAALHTALSYAEALGIIKESGVLHPRCVRLAEKNGVSLHVRSFLRADQPGTTISGEAAAELSLPLYETEPVICSAGGV